MPLRFTLRQLEYFVAVGRAGSIAAAAERVNVSSPSISAAIAQLETEFGIQLFIRQHAQGLSLTPGGRRFLAEAELLLESAEALHELSSDIAEKPRGPINVGCLVTLAPILLAALRRGFEAVCPEARVTQAEANQERLIEMLRRAEIDVAITYDLEIPRDVAFEPLAALPPCAMVSAAHRLAGRSTIALADLADEPMVLLDLPLSREYFLSLFQASDLRPRIAERSRDMAVVRSLVANGYGYALVNIRPRNQQAPDGNALALLRLDGGYRPMTLGLATMRTDRKPRILRAFEDHCRSAIGDDRIPGMVTR
ncbi:MAG: LysR family transcriptional regulator [Amaricoccus sp.]|nr:LysR family transcriptional regulator [Amaricoccus sp.]MBP7243047.1 LysR family transcriptional regulator [Amaricoccus sp.]